jgi:alpha-tubulin suppressor-like RCC1 family protein
MSTTHHPADLIALDRRTVWRGPSGWRERALFARVVAVTLLVVGAVAVTVMAADSSSPAAAAPTSAWAQVSAGRDHTCALTNAGQVFCWGRDDSGQLGNGASITGDQESPSPVDGPAGVSWASISAGGSHTCALSDTGDIFCWGNDSSGQLGNGAAISGIQASPSPVDGPVGVGWVSISAGTFHTCGVTGVGHAFCWGSDDSGQLGNGASIVGNQVSPSPVDTPAVTTWSTAISAAGFHTCAVTVAGDAFCWGSDGDGQLGNGAAITGAQVSPSPVDTPAGVTLRPIDAGADHTCAVSDTGDGSCWGSDRFGQLGNGGRDHR